MNDRCEFCGVVRQLCKAPKAHALRRQRHFLAHPSERVAKIDYRHVRCFADRFSNGEWRVS